MTNSSTYIPLRQQDEIVSDGPDPIKEEQEEEFEDAGFTSDDLTERHDPTSTRTRAQYCLALLRVVTGWFFQIIIPSFLQKPGTGRDAETNRPPTGKLSTAWLDGLRGIASFVVFIFHFSGRGHPGIKWGYGAKDEHEHKSVLQLPIINLIYHGRTMVSIFFVISGYALSFSTLKSIHKQDYDGLYKRLTSSVFRRTIRLVLPSFAAVFAMYVAQRLGLVVKKEHESTLWNDTWAMLTEFDRIMNPFTWSPPVKVFYGPQLWTIPVELRASFALFVTLIGLSRSRVSIRITVLAFLYSYSLYQGRWDIALFMAGIALAECNILSDQSASRTIELPQMEQPSERPTLLNARYKWNRIQSTRSRRFLHTLGWIGLLVPGLYIASYPKLGAATSPFWSFIAQIGWGNEDLKSRTWSSIGATMTVVALSYLPRCQALLETAPIIYLGKISYTLYLFHNVVNKLVGMRLIDLGHALFGTETWIAREGVYVGALLLNIPVLIWFADLTWRLVDLPAVMLAKWAEKKCSVVLS